MFSKTTTTLLFVGAGIIVYSLAKSIATYFMHSDAPIITISIDPTRHYAQTLPLSITVQTAYALGNIAATIDEHEVVIPELSSMQPPATTIQPSLPIDHLTTGEHTLMIAARDKSYHRNKGICHQKFYVDHEPLAIASTITSIEVQQGKTIHLVWQSNKDLSRADATLIDKKYPCYPVAHSNTTYECFIPVECEQLPQSTTLTIAAYDKTDRLSTLNIPVTINAAPFPKQRGLRVSDEKLEREKEASMSNKILESALEKWLTQSPSHKLWHGPFEKPVEVKWISTPFGEIRTTPQRGRYHHLGVDLANHPKSVIWASNHGKVIIKDRFLLTGNTVVIDHGLGVFTLYCHLEDFTDIEVGDFVKKGNPIGRLGMTGYASGYHLHWELRVHNISVDPFEWTTSIY